ncbi:MAG: phosphoribosylglycinamide formyltransferase [Lachnospirales bacterium]
MKTFVVLASGTGSNFLAISKACIDKRIDGHVELLIVNKKSAGAVEKAEMMGVKYAYNDFKNIDSVIHTINEINPDLIFLAGFMKILPEKFIKAFENKIINVHPSILPKYKGLHAVERAMEDGEKEIGATIHYVDTGVDTGEIIMQEKFNIENLTLDEVYEKLHKIEHSIYIKSIIKITEERK